MNFWENAKSPRPTPGRGAAMSSGFGGRRLVSTDAVYALRSYAVVFIIGIIGATPLAAKLIAKLRTKEAVGKVINVAEPFVLVLLLAVCTAYMVDGAFNPFLYFRF